MAGGCVAADAEKEKEGVGDMEELEADPTGLWPFARKVSLLMGGTNLSFRGRGERGSFVRGERGQWEKRGQDRQGVSL